MHQCSHEDLSESEALVTGNLPSVKSQIQNLTPTHSLISFYSSKLEKYEQLVAEIGVKLDGYRLEHKYQLNLENRVRHVMDQNENLRTSLTSLRDVLSEERQNTLRVKAENARLKLQELADRKKIHHLLMLNGITDEETIALFLKNELPLSKISEIPCCSHHQPNKEALTTSKIFSLETDNDILYLQIRALQAELSERTEFALKERDALIAENEGIVRDHELRKNNDAVLIQDLTEQLQKTQSVLHDHLQSFVTLRKTVSVPDLYMQQKERSHPTQTVSKATSPIRHQSKEANPTLHKESVKFADLPHLTEKMVKDPKLKKTVCKHHEQRIRSLQEEVSLLRQQLHKESQDGPNKYKQLKERIEILTARNKGLERRRKLDNEGFRSDIALVRSQVHDIQKQLLKVSEIALSSSFLFFFIFQTSPSNFLRCYLCLCFLGPIRFP